MICGEHVMDKLFELTDPHLHYLYHVCEASLFYSCPFSFRAILKLTNVVCVKSAIKFFKIMKIDCTMPEWFVF